MAKSFQKIGLFSRSKHEGSAETIGKLIEFLKSQHLEIFIETETATQFAVIDIPIVPPSSIGQYCDLLIVIGGDGSLLQAVRHIIDDEIPVLGINRGRLGFLTDIHPDEVTIKISEILAGHYQEEKRFLLTAQAYHQDAIIAEQDALNDVVLMQGDNPHLIEFEIYIDDLFVCSQRADGLITATPTGSTAYALSGGGPILHPSLDACVIVPMFPHTLSSRPIVINGNSCIKIVMSAKNVFPARLSCDGQKLIIIHPNDYFIIRKKHQQLRLIHPLDYQYFQTLRSKLQWGTKLGQG